MGGEFNPVHYGHLNAAEQAGREFSLDEVVFVPAGIPPHRDPKILAAAEHRFRMTVLATSTNPLFSVSKIEIERQGPSFTVDTLKQFNDIYAARSPELFFITGYDAVMEIPSWHKPGTIMKLCTVIAASRPGCDESMLEKNIGPKFFPKIKLLRIPALEVSSTDIRRRVSTGQAIKYLLPESVEEYIIKNRLYI